MTKSRETSQDERLEIAKECLENRKNYGEAAQKYVVSYQQVYTWVKRFSELGEAGLEDRRGQRTAQQSPRTAEEELKARIAQLEHENYMLKMERDLLKKVKELERGDRWDWRGEIAGTSKTGTTVPGDSRLPRGISLSYRRRVPDLSCIQGGILQVEVRPQEPTDNGE